MDLFLFWKIFLKYFLTWSSYAPGKEFSQTEPPNSFCVLSNLKSHSGPVTMLCVLHNQTYTEALCEDASFQMVPCETLVLGSILIRGTRHRNAPFSGIERIGGICSYMCRMLVSTSTKAWPEGKSPSWEVWNRQEAAVYWGRKEEGAGKPPVSPVLYSTGTDYEVQSFKRQEAKNLLPHCVSVPQRTVTLWSQEALDCSFEKRQLAGYSMSNK